MIQWGEQNLDTLVERVAELIRAKAGKTMPVIVKRVREKVAT